MPSFDLVDEAWIPCIPLDGGKPRAVSLRAALIDAAAYQEIFDASPLVTAAIYRLVLSVVHRIFAPHDLPSWKRLWEQERWNEAAVAAYLDQWRSRFDLFDEDRPFYQQASLLAKSHTPLKRLAFEFAAQNNATLFDHSSDNERPHISPAIAARWLLASQAFSPSAGKSETLHTKDSPWSRGAVILWQGDNLFETLALNLLNLFENNFPTVDGDQPTWENEHIWEPQHQAVPTGVLEYLSWQSRSVRLLPESGGTVRECLFAQGRALERFRDDPMLAYTRSKDEGLHPWLLDPERAVWRDLHTLLPLSSGVVARLPTAFNHIARLVGEGFLERRRRLHVHVIGQGLVSGKATILLWSHERLPLPLAYLQDKRLVDALAFALNESEKIAQHLHQSLSHLARLLLAPNSNHKERNPNKEVRALDKKDKNKIAKLMKALGAEPLYWSRLDAAFRRFLVDLPSQQLVQHDGSAPDNSLVLDEWIRTLCHTATASFGDVTHTLDSTARTLKAVTIAERQLHINLGAHRKRHIVHSEEKVHDPAS